MSDFTQTGRCVSESNKLAEEASKTDRTSGEHRENRSDEDPWLTTAPDIIQYKWKKSERNDIVLHLTCKHSFNYRRKR